MEVKTKYNLLVINSEQFALDPNRYELRRGIEENAPACPFGNRFEWIGYDKKEEKYVRFTKSVFRRLITEIE